MSDPRDFDMRQIPGVEAVLATGVPESCSIADLFMAQEARASVGLDRDQTHYACRQCASCHCHNCVMQEREVKRQAVQSLVDERDALRAALERYAEAILTAISSEDGLDGADGMRLLQETEEGRALLTRMAGRPEV